MKHHHPHNSDQHTHHAHDHTHGVVEPALFTSQRGITAVKWSFLGLLLAALLQLVVAVFSHSAALLADTLHNLTDAATALPLWIAFKVSRWNSNKRFTYGYGRVEDLAGLTVVLMILGSVIGAAYVAIDRLIHPVPVEYIWAVAMASLIGFIGNELVARIRIKAGKEIGSAALIADGYHARVDGFTSLAVLVGALGVWLGYPLADPIIGILITVVITRVLWEAGKSIFTRLLDGVDPDVVDEIRESMLEVPGVREVTEVRVRWLGHRMHAEGNITVSSDVSIERGHRIANEARHELLHRLTYLSNATIHVDPDTASGEHHHRIDQHVHGNLPPHSH